MSLGRALRFLPLMLVALLLPKCLTAVWLRGGLSAAYILDSDIGSPGFWSGWLGAMLLVLLTYVWFVWPQPKRFALGAFVLLFASSALLVIAARWTDVPVGDGIVLDTLGMLVALYLASIVTAIRRLRLANSDNSAVERNWVQTLMAFINWLLWMAGFIGLMARLANAFGFNAMLLLIYFFSWMLIARVCVVAYVAGRFFGATISGMQVLQVRVLSLELYRRRGWWLLRWAPEKGRGYKGFVYAAFNPSLSMRNQALTMMVMGPAAYLLVSLLLAGFAWAASARPMLYWSANALAIFSGVAAITALIPRKGTDGAQLLWWWRHTDDNRPELAYWRLLSRSVFGTTADALHEEDIACLENQPMPNPLTAMWYRLKGAQHAADWGRAAELGGHFDDALAAWERQPKALRFFIEHFRAEVAFSRVLATGDIALLHDNLLSRDTKKLVPTLWPRCMALKAILMGSRADSERLLEQCMAEAKRSPDLALQKSEAILAQHILRQVTNENA